MCAIEHISIAALAFVLMGSDLLAHSTPMPFRGSGVLYVDDSSTNGLNDGSSWENAYVYLQDAIANAGYQSGVSQIWIAEGTYKPDQGLYETPGDQLASFVLPRTVSFYGGFAGTEDSLDQRDPRIHPTILSGDLHDDDNPRDLTSIIVNSVHVVTAYSTWATVDGVVIKGGNATWEYPHGSDSGGGVKVGGGRTTFVNCVFEDNSASLGGAMYVDFDHLSLVGCIFRRNRAIGTADWGYPPVGSGAALATEGGYISVTNCVFDGNKATGDGGAVYTNAGAYLTVVNCTMAENASYRSGGGIFVQNNGYPGSLTIANSILWGNRAAGQGGESAQLSAPPPAVVNVNYSCVEGSTGSLGGLGNTGSDPRLFRASTGGLTRWFEVDAVQEMGLALRAGSPAIDAGDSSADTDAYLDGNQPIPAFDFDGLPRFLDDPGTSDAGAGDPPVVDMGAFEFQPQDCNRNRVQDGLDLAAGTSIDCDQTGLPDECELDCNRSGVADACELASGSSTDCNLNQVPDDCEADCNRNHIVDECDNLEATSSDCNGNAIPDECDPPAILQTELRASDPAPDYQLGWSAAIRGDWAILGSIDGTAGIFRRGSLGWAQEAILPDPGGWHFDAVSVALGEDVAVVGAPLVDHADLDLEGAAYVFRRRAAGWIQEAKLVMTADGEESDFFGSSVAISRDVLVVGTHAWDDGGYATGAVYVFRYAPSQERWVQQAKLASPSPQHRTFFGSSVSISNDTIVVAAPGEWSGGTHYGAAHIFRHVGSPGTWIHEARLTPSIDSRYHGFGSPVSVAGDIVAVGARVDMFGPKSGRVFVFRRLATRQGWGEEAMLTPSDPFPGDQFGDTVAVSGETILVGAQGNDDPPYDSGAAYLFRFNGAEWTQDARLVSPNPEPWDWVGGSVALDGNQALVGAVGRGGAGLVFVLNGDCNANGVPDSCDIADGTVTDCDTNGVPDDCQPDCNGNGVNDPCDIGGGSIPDCNQNAVPDDCEPDCNGNSIADTCDIVAGTSQDCQLDDVPDECEVAHGDSPDCDHTGIPDECELDPD